MPPTVEYFAFVESIDRFSEAAAFERNPDDPASILLDYREKEHLPNPSHSIWLDCVDAEYFIELPWRDEECEIGDAEDGLRRRKRLSSLDSEKFVSILLLINGRRYGQEKEEINRFNEMDWHLVSIGDKDGLPVLIAPDFDMEGATLKRYLKHERFCSNHEYRSLRNVFSLDFIPDARFDEDDRDRNRSKLPSPQDGPASAPESVQELHSGTRYDHSSDGAEARQKSNEEQHTQLFNSPPLTRFHDD